MRSFFVARMKEGVASGQGKMVKLSGVSAVKEVAPLS